MSDTRIFATDDKGRLLVRHYLDGSWYVEKLWYPEASFSETFSNNSNGYLLKTTENVFKETSNNTEGDDSPYNPKYKNDILEQREKQWGDPFITHGRIGEVWTAIAKDILKEGAVIDAYHVALFMVGLKLIRATINPSDPDSLDDLDGYSELAQLFVTIEAELEKEKENDAV